MAFPIEAGNLLSSARRSSGRVRRARGVDCFEAAPAASTYDALQRLETVLACPFGISSEVARIRDGRGTFARWWLIRRLRCISDPRLPALRRCLGALLHLKRVTSLRDGYGNDVVTVSQFIRRMQSYSLERSLLDIEPARGRYSRSSALRCAVSWRKVLE